MTWNKNEADGFDRQALYEEVWSTSMVKVAEKYGISDKGLTKICAKMRIPLPGVGFWAKKAAGKPAVKVELPPLPLVDSTVQEGPFHPLVEATIKAYDSRYSDRYGNSRYRLPLLSIRVGKYYENRAYKFATLLFETLEKSGHTVAIKHGYQDDFKTTVSIDGEEVAEAISISERHNGTSDIFEYLEAGAQKKVIISGGIELNIEYGYFAIERRKKWTETYSKLERQIEEIVAHIKKVSDSVLAKKKAREKEEKMKQKALKMKEKFECLETQAICWGRAQAIRKYLEAVEKSASKKGTNREALDRWLLDGKKLADKLDPITGEWRDSCPEFAIIEDIRHPVQSYQDNTWPWYKRRWYRKQW